MPMQRFAQYYFATGPRFFTVLPKVALLPRLLREPFRSVRALPISTPTDESPTNHAG